MTPMLALGLLLLAAGLAASVSTLAARPRRPRLDLDLGWGVADRGAERAGPLARAAAAVQARVRWGGPAGLAVDLYRVAPGRTPIEFLLAAGAVAATAGLLVAAAGNGAIGGVVAAVAVAAAARLLLARRSRSWALRFDEQLPEALDLLAGSLESGSSLAQAMNLVVSEGGAPLRDEFGRIVAENGLGEPLVDAMASAARRVGSRDFLWCVRAVRVQQEFGASLSAVLRTLADFVRWRQELRREVRTLTAEGRISAYILVALPVLIAAFFALVNPSYLAPLVRTPMGGALLALAAGLMTIGTVWMTRVVRVKP